MCYIWYMKSRSIFVLCAVVVVVLATLSFRKMNDEPWKPEQLLAPAELAKTIGDPAVKQPMVICIGPGAVIKGSIDIGPAKDSDNVNKLRQRLSQLPKDADIVIYCGCCPMDRCPNIRPAWNALKELGFTRVRVLNIPTNMAADWYQKDYPSEAGSAGAQ